MNDYMKSWDFGNALMNNHEEDVYILMKDIQLTIEDIF